MESAPPADFSNMPERPLATLSERAFLFVGKNRFADMRFAPGFKAGTTRCLGRSHFCVATAMLPPF
jgi:hypothetical protein